MAADCSIIRPWLATTACWCRLIQPASISATSCPGEHHDFDFMGAILLRTTAVTLLRSALKELKVARYPTIQFRHITGTSFHLRDCARDVGIQAEGRDGRCLCPFTGKHRETAPKKKMAPQLTRKTRTENRDLSPGEDRVKPSHQPARFGDPLAVLQASRIGGPLHRTTAVNAVAEQPQSAEIR